MIPTALVCSGMDSSVNPWAEAFPKHSILQDGANSTDDFCLYVDVVSGSLLLDALDASRYASVKPPAIFVAF